MSRGLEIIRTLRTTPPLPSIAFRVMDLVRDPEFRAEELVELVRTDPSLTARVLRLCNSAMFALPNEVTSVADAVAYLGTRNLVKLVMVCCAANRFRDLPDSAYGSPADLWRHTFAVATACQWLAARAGGIDPATAFTVGILHNIGKVALTQIAGDGITVAASSDATQCEREAALFDIDHAAAAGVIADTWSLPREIAEALRGHHDPAACASGPVLAALLGVADDLVLAAGIGRTLPGPPPTVPAASLARLRLGTGDLEQAIADVSAALERSAELLNLGEGSSR